MTDRRYHARFLDDVSGEELGLVLLERPQVGVQRRIVNPYAAKTGQGDTQYSDLTEWTVAAQDDWRGGRGQHLFHDDKTAFHDSLNLETRVEGQITLGPYPHIPDADAPYNVAALEGEHMFGWGAPEVCDVEQHSEPWWYETGIKIGQQVNEQWQYLPNDRNVSFLESVELKLRAENLGAGVTVTVGIWSSTLAYDSDLGPVHQPDTLLGTATVAGNTIPTASHDWVTFTLASPLDLSACDTWWITLEHDGATSSQRISWAQSAKPNAYPRGHLIYWYNQWFFWGSPWKKSDMLFKINWANIKMAQQFTVGDSNVSISSVGLWGVAWFKRIKVSLYSDSGSDTPNALIKSSVVGSASCRTVGEGSTTTVIKVDRIGDTVAGMWVEINDEIRQISSVSTVDTTITLTSALTAAPEEGDRITNPYWQNGGTYTWKQVRLPAQVYSSGTKYWIVVEQLDAGRSLFNGWSALGYGGTYAGGVVAYKVGSEAWAEFSATADLMFRINAAGLTDDVVGFARFNDNIYCAAGDTVYVWSEAIDGWTAKDTVAGKSLTDLEVWGGYLWAARGSVSDMRRTSNGTDWADVTDVKANLLKVGGAYLHYSGTGANEHIVYYTADGTDWATLGECGAGDHPVRGMAWYRDSLYAANDIALWRLALEGWPYPVLDWSAQEDEYNGVGMESWNKTACLYIPLRYGLYRWNGDSMIAVGPERGTGLPEQRAGNIVAILPTNNWLYVAVDAGDGRTSSILCYGGIRGWHEIARHPQELESIQTLFYSTLTTPSRLWYGVGAQTRYLELPDRSDNPFQWRSYSMWPSGELTTSWIGGDLIEVLKDLHEIVIRGEDIDSDHYIDVWVQVDRNKTREGDDLWFYWGQASETPRTSLKWVRSKYLGKLHSVVSPGKGNSSPLPAWQQRTLTSGSTKTQLVLDASEYGAPIGEGEFVRVNGEICQVQYAEDDTVYLANALETAPSDGDILYASLPAGHEFRVRLSLNSYDVGDIVQDTPKLTYMLVRYQNNVLDRFLWTLKINCGETIKDLGGAAYPLSAADLRAALDDWATRKTPFWLIDQDGRYHRVKVTAAGEGGLTRKETAGGGAAYNSTYNFNLVEVE